MRSALARLSTPSLAAGAIVTTIALLIGVLIVQSNTETELEQRLGDGAAWLASSEIGGVSLLDGASGTSATDLVVASAGDVFGVVQWGSDALVVNETRGSVSRLDGATWRIGTGEIRFAEPGGALRVLADGETGWVVADGLVSSINLEDLGVLDQYAIGSTVTSAAIGNNGTLFLGSDAADGSVMSISAEDESPQTVSGLSGSAVLVELGDRVGAIDTEAQSVWIEGEGIVCDSLPYPEGESVLAGGSSDFLVTVSSAGRLMVWDPTKSGCPDANGVLELDRGRFGSPVMSDGWGLVPDYEASVVYIFEGAGESLTRVDLTNVPEGAHFDLIEEGGSVWYNDAASDAAGLVRRDGTITALSKYLDGDEGFSVAPLDQSDADQAAQVAGVQLERDEATTTTTAAPSDEATPTTAPAGVAVPTPEDTTSSTTSTTTPQSLAIEIAAGAQQAVAGDSVTFSALTLAGQPTSYTWSISPSAAMSTSTLRSTQITFANTGSYIVSVNACDAASQCASANASFAVVGNPDQIQLVAAIRGASSVQTGKDLRLADASQGNPESWSWSLDGGTSASSTSADVTVRWDTPGLKTVSLTVERDGVTKSATKQITVSDPATEPSPFGVSCNTTSLDAGANAFCQLSGTATDFANLQWTATNGGQLSSPTSADTNVTKVVAGSVVVTLKATDIGTGKAASDSVTIAFATPPAVEVSPSISGPSSVETGGVNTFTANGSGVESATLVWKATGATIGSPNAQSTTLRWNTAGVYEVELTANGVRAVKSVTVTDAPTASTPLVVTVTNDGAQETSFHMTISLNRCAQLDWTLAFDGQSHTQGNTTSDCRTSYILAPYSNTVLAANTNYTINATFTEPDGTVTPWTTSVTTTTQSAPPTVNVTGLSYSGTTVTATVTSSPCTTLYWWFSGTKSGQPRHEQTFTVSTCQTSRTITFEGRLGFSYTVQVNGTDPSNGQVTTVNNTIAIPDTPPPSPVTLTLKEQSTSGSGFTVLATASECAVITYRIDSGPQQSSGGCVSSLTIDSSYAGPFLPGTNHIVSATATTSDGRTDTTTLGITTGIVFDPTLYVAAVTETSFIIGADLTQCAAVSWSISPGGASASDPSCTVNHRMGTNTVVTLAPGTTYNFTATFTTATGQTATRSISVTTDTEPVDPLVISSTGVSAVNASWTLSTNQCATASGYWAEIGGAERSGSIEVGTCTTGFFFQVSGPESGATYVFNVTISSTEGGGSQLARSPEFVYP